MFRRCFFHEGHPLAESLLGIPGKGFCFLSAGYFCAVSETLNYRIEYFTKFAAIILFTGAVVSLFWQRIRAVRVKKTKP